MNANCLSEQAPEPPDPLPSWRTGLAKHAILDFVRAVTADGSPCFVPPRDRIAVFDNDGTLWPEMPLPIQFFFLQDRARAAIAADPGLREAEPYRSVLAGDIAALRRYGADRFFTWVASLHEGLTPWQAETAARTWLAQARHPTLGRPFTALAYQPMRELLAYLRASAFRVWVVTGSGADFVRALAEDAYGLLPEQVIGSSAVLQIDRNRGVVAPVKAPHLELFVDRESKAAAVSARIGRRPILACGNADSDLALFEYASSEPGPCLVLIVHHDDSQREWSYERAVALSPLDDALRLAPDRGWQIVSMRDDFAVIFST